MVSYRSSIVLARTFRYLICFQLIFFIPAEPSGSPVNFYRWCKVCMWLTSYPTTIVVRLFFAPLNDAGIHVENQLTIGIWVYFGLQVLFH